MDFALLAFQMTIEKKSNAERDPSLWKRGQTVEKR